MTTGARWAAHTQSRHGGKETGGFSPDKAVCEGNLVRVERNLGGVQGDSFRSVIKPDCGRVEQMFVCHHANLGREFC